MPLCGAGWQPAGSLRGGWLPPLSRANARGTLWVGPIAKRPQLAKLLGMSALRSPIGMKTGGT
jgi:hypothetical protein